MERQMGFARRLTDIIMTALRTGDVEPLRDSLVDETDAAHEGPNDIRRIYMRVWGRLSEFDYGHIDREQLLDDLRALASELSCQTVVTPYSAGTTMSGRVAVTISQPFRGVGVWGPDSSASTDPDAKPVNLVGRRWARSG
jgi:hypothetical protein